MQSHLSFRPTALFGALTGKLSLHRRLFVRTMTPLSFLLLFTAIGPGTGMAQTDAPSLDSYCETVTLPQRVLVGGQTFGNIDHKLRLASIRTIETQGQFASDVFSIEPTSRQLFLEDGHYVRLRYPNFSDTDESIEVELSCEAIPEKFGRPASGLHAHVAALQNVPSIEGYKLVSASRTRYGADNYLGLWVGTGDTGEGRRDSLLVEFSASEREAKQNKADFEILTRIPIAFDLVSVEPALHGPIATIYLISNPSKGRGDMVIASLRWSR